MNVTRMLSGRSLLRFLFEVGSTLLIFLFLGFSLGCKSRTQSEPEAATPPGDRLELLFTYGSEKEKWINEVTNEFNRADHKTSGGKHIYVRALPMGSGESIDEVMEGHRQPHLISPASAAFIKLG